MPKDVPEAKLEGTRAHGAEIVFYDRRTDDREAIAARLCAERGAILIKPFDQAEVIAGQGTIGLEIAQDAARLDVRLDTVLVPCSGGGLASGVALGLNGGAVVHTVEPMNFDGMKRSLEAGRRVAAPGGALSVADALMAPAPGEIVFEVARELLGPGFTVDDDALRRAVAFAAARLKLVVEPGGGAALAALLEGAVPNQVVVIVLSGANG
jgi:threonine dehydratase